MKITNVTAQMQSVRDDLFEKELEDMEARQRAPRGRKRDFTPIMTLEDQDEVDAQVAQDLIDLQKEYFGKPGGMGTGRRKKPWEKDQLDPYKNREPTKEELEEIERNVAPDSELGISERELAQILDEESGLVVPDDFTDEEAALEDEIPEPVQKGKKDEVDWDFWRKVEEHAEKEKAERAQRLRENPPAKNPATRRNPDTLRY